MKLTLKTRWGSSAIILENGIFKKAGELLRAQYPRGRFVILTDSNLNRIFGTRLKTLFPDSPILTVEPNENAKSFKTVMTLAEELLKANTGSHDVLVGFGGGLVTDVGGFLASIYRRGMHYAAIPTTMMGMVDAALGGQNGVDFLAKNLLGTNYLPEVIVIDPDFLKSITDLRKMTGIAEVIKYGAIADPTILAELETLKARKRLRAFRVGLRALLVKSIKSKIKISSRDIREPGWRKILDFGHTFGHALESASDYTLRHDEAVSIGIVLANKIAQKLGKQKKEVGGRIEAILKQFGLPTEIPSNLPEGADGHPRLQGLIRNDKKNRKGILSFILITEPGKAEIVKLTPEKIMELAF